MFFAYLPWGVEYCETDFRLNGGRTVKRHILSYPKIIVSKNPRGVGEGEGGGFRYLAHGLISFEEKGEPKRNRTEVPLLTSLTPTARPNRSTKTVEVEYRL